MSGYSEAAYTHTYDRLYDFDIGILPLYVEKDCQYTKGGVQDLATLVPWTIFTTQCAGSNPIWDHWCRVYGVEDKIEDFKGSYKSR
jgi:hypothetical protein